MIWVIHPSTHSSIIFCICGVGSWCKQAKGYSECLPETFSTHSWGFQGCYQAKLPISGCTGRSLLSWSCQEDFQRETSAIWGVLIWLPKPPQLIPVRKKNSDCSHLWHRFVLFPSKLGIELDSAFFELHHISAGSLPTATIKMHFYLPAAFSSISDEKSADGASGGLFLHQHLRGFDSLRQMCGPDFPCRGETALVINTF